MVDLKTNEVKKISVIPQPYQKPHPPITQVVDSVSSIEWAAQNMELIVSCGFQQ